MDREEPIQVAYRQVCAQRSKIEVGNNLYQINQTISICHQPNKITTFINGNELVNEFYQKRRDNAKEI